jgi:hypothetical protein
MKETFYRKVGRKYVEVSQYDDNFCNSYPIGSHLVTVEKGCAMRKMNVDPALLPLIAATELFRSELAQVIVKASDAYPSSQFIGADLAAYQTFKASLSPDKMYYLSYPSANEVATAALSMLTKKAEALLQNDAVKQAYDNFILISKLSDEHNPNKETK